MAGNPESILDSVKMALNVDAANTSFDVAILMHINSAFGSLKQLGVGSDDGFSISGNTTLWSQYISSSEPVLSLVKAYIVQMVRLAWDPPSTSFVIASLKDQIGELGFRILLEGEHIYPPVDSDLTELVGINTYRPTVMTYAATVTPNAAVFNIFRLTLTGDCMIEAPINAPNGKGIILEVVPAGFAITWGSGWYFSDTTYPKLSNDTSLLVAAIYDETSLTWKTPSSSSDDETVTF